VLTRTQNENWNVCFIILLMDRRKGKYLYGDCWVMAWTTDWAPGERSQSALGAQVKAIHVCDQKGWSLDAPLRPHLRADCHCGKVSGWRSLLCGVLPVSLGLWMQVSTFTFQIPSYLFWSLCCYTPVLPFHCINLSDCNSTSHEKWVESAICG